MNEYNNSFMAKKEIINKCKISKMGGTICRIGKEIKVCSYTDCVI